MMIMMIAQIQSEYILPNSDSEYVSTDEIILMMIMMIAQIQMIQNIFCQIVIQNMLVLMK